jgi:hypothetical protein
MSTLAERFTNRLPFVVGVTGHRHLVPADEARLGAEIDAVLARLRDQLVDTPLLLLCGMAAGADLLCAERAFAAGIPVCALLPAPLDRYEQDFSAAERARLHAALDRVVEMRVLDDDPDRGYVRLATTIARYSHLVVALWDGVESRGHGGTGDVVRMRMEGYEQRDHAAGRGVQIFAFPDVGPVVHIPTSRADGPPVAGPAEHIYPPRFDGDTAAEHDANAATKRLECFNRDLREQLVDATATRTLHDAVDALSNILQRRIRLVTNLLYLAFAAATTVQILRFPAPLQSGLLACGLLLYVFARRANIENRYQDYRALSEALRVHEAWTLDGIVGSVDACYLRMHQSELQWIRLALRTVELLEPPRHVALAELGVRGACYRWLEGQWGWYQRTRAREERRSRRFDTTGKLLVAVGAVSAALAWLLPEAVVHLHQRPLAEPATWFRVHGQTVFTLCSAYAAILAAYAGKFGYANNAKRYERMFLVFDVVKRRIAKLPPESAADAESILLETGREALVEHADWLLQRRERPLTFTIQR